MRDIPDLAAYQAAIDHHGARPVVLETTVLDLTMLVSALQLALRHPRFPASVRPYVEGFLQGAITQVGTLDAVLKQALEAGHDPRHDVP